MAPVGAEHVFEMTAAENEDPVEAVGANRADPTLGECVRVGPRKAKESKVIRAPCCLLGQPVRKKRRYRDFAGVCATPFIDAGLWCGVVAILPLRTWR